MKIWTVSMLFVLFYLTDRFTVVIAQSRQSTASSLDRKFIHKDRSICSHNLSKQCNEMGTEKCVINHMSEEECFCKKEYMGKLCQEPRNPCEQLYRSKPGKDWCGEGVKGVCVPVIGSSKFNCDCFDNYTVMEDIITLAVDAHTITNITVNKCDIEKSPIKHEAPLVFDIVDVVKIIVVCLIVVIMSAVCCFGCWKLKEWDLHRKQMERQSLERQRQDNLDNEFDNLLQNCYYRHDR